MFRYLRHTEQPLFIFSGAVQPAAVKTLYTSSKLSQTDVQNLIHFCFPLNSKVAGPIFFTNRYKPTGGKFYNVFCLLDQTSFNLNQMDRNEQCCLCFVSEFDEPYLFEELLKYLRSLLLNSDIKSAEMFLRNLSITIPDSLNQHLCKPLKVSDNISLKILGILILGLLCDSSFVVVSSEIDRVSKFCYELQMLILPLKWHHIFVPVLPSKFIETLQSPAPFIVGLHRSLVSAAEKEGIDSDGHILIDIDADADGQYSITTKNMEPFPSWAMNIAGGLKSSTLCDRQNIIMRLICFSLGIQPANSPQITAKRINNAIQYIRFEPNSFIFSLLNSRTLQSFFDAMKDRSMPREYKKLLERANSSVVTSLAVQKVEEFPIAKRKKTLISHENSSSSSSSSASLLTSNLDSEKINIRLKKGTSEKKVTESNKSVLEVDSSSGSSPIIDLC